MNDALGQVELNGVQCFRVASGLPVEAARELNWYGVQNSFRESVPSPGFLVIAMCLNITIAVSMMMNEVFRRLHSQ